MLSLYRIGDRRNQCVAGSAYGKFGCHAVGVYTRLSVFSILTFNVGFDLLFRVPRDRVEVRNRIREE
ncbi:hypothetical protein K0M31_019575 [Melipona bicolor]|uniref:Uncharacterized protein n=1 Tax=Melipona bicolor TaxID=60889 RepID=A0AA40KR75_9HYME|nr:hypothetical protein K0M31_019575 [Melipona bicolor]